LLVPFAFVLGCSLHCFQLPHLWYRWGQYQSSLNWITADELLDDLKRKPSTKQQQQLLVGQQRQGRDGGGAV
jgi:hypothetical protein